MKTSLLWLVSALIAVLPPTSAMAQAITASARISPQTAYVGESVSYVISINDIDSADAPSLPDIDGLRIAYAGPSSISQTNIVNGRRTQTRSLSLQYSVVAIRAGEFVIPAQTLLIDGQRVDVNEVRFRAVEAPESENFELHATVEQTSLYVGEPTTLSVTWYLAAQPGGFEFIGGFDGLPLESYPAARASRGRQSADQANAVFDGEQVTGDVGQATLAGRVYTTFTIERTIVPTRAGTIEIPPITVAFDEVVGTRGSGIFREDRTERRVARSRPVTLTVRPLPTEGRPANFNGLIGRYDIGAVAEPLDVNVGDPITLRAIVTGPEPIARVPAPSIDDDPSFVEHFKPSPDGWAVATTPGGARTFTTTIRATNDSVDAIPPIELPYFDTELGEYRIARSDPIPLTVRATREVTAADAVGGAGPAAPAFRSGLESGSGGIQAIFTSPAALASQRAPVLDRMITPVWIAAGAAPPAAYLALVGFLAIRRREDVETTRRRHAKRRALARLRSGDATDALRGYLADRFGEDEDAMTAWDGRTLLGPIDTSLAEESHALLSVAEAERFGGESPPADAARVRELIRRIDKETTR